MDVQTNFLALVQILKAGDTPRVSSLLVTVFGDLLNTPQSAMSGAALNAITRAAGVKPEATRVALHRLRKEGWIDSNPRGRQTSYALTRWGQSQCDAASPAIYAAEPRVHTAWLVICDSITPDTERPQNAQILTPQVYLSAQISDSEKQFSTPITVDTPIPDWMRRKLVLRETLQLAENLSERLNALQDHAARLDQLNAFEKAVIRVLIVHSWRRIVLKAPQLPDHVFPLEWRGPDCRSKVAALLSALNHPALQDIEASLPS